MKKNHFSGEVCKKVDVDFLMHSPKLIDGVKYPVIVNLHSAGFYKPEYVHSLMDEYLIKRITDRGFWLVEPINTKNDIWNPDDIYFLMKKLEQGGDIWQSNAIDFEKSIIMGLSMGARGCFDVICDYPDLFRIAIPIAGFAAYLRAPRILNTRTSVLAFHGNDDNIVPIHEVQKMIGMLTEHHFAKLIILKGDHGIGHLVYDDQNVFNWIKKELSK